MGLDPAKDLKLRSLSNIGDTKLLEEDVSACPCYASYGFPRGAVRGR